MAFGVVGLVGLKIPHGDVGDRDAIGPAPVEPSPTVGDRSRPSATAGTDPDPSPPPGSAAEPTGPVTRTITGSREAAGDYGYVQVRITMVGSEMTEIILLEVTDSPKRAVRQAPEILIEEALAAQSADIEDVSGATYTSGAFKLSLESALDEA
jgi:hypothetical protein